MFLKKNLYLVVFLALLLALVARFYSVLADEGQEILTNFQTEKIVSSDFNDLNLKILDNKEERILSLETLENEIKVSTGQFVIDVKWVNESEFIYTWIESLPENPDDFPLVSISLGNISGESEVLESKISNQVVIKPSNLGKKFTYSTPTNIYVYDLETRSSDMIIQFEEFGENSSILYVPEVFWAENDSQISFVEKSYKNGEVLSETKEIRL